MSIKRLMFIVVSRRRSPSIVNWAIWSRIFSRSASVRSFTFLEYAIPVSSQILRARVRPMPKIAVRPISACWCGGMLMPAIRAMSYLLTLTLLVAGVGADDTHDTLAANDLAVAADLLDGSRNSHVLSPKSGIQPPSDVLKLAFLSSDSYCWLIR